ncbi:single-stranded-DNA-specific exonuclease RecJ [Aquifex sp.]
MRGVSGKRWILLYTEVKPKEETLRRFGRVFAQILVNRGFEEGVELLLEPKLSRIPGYSRIPGIGEAVERIKKAIKGGEKIILFGDYDVDGITGTSILYSVLKKAGAKVYPILPNRQTGYGLNRELISVFEKYGELLITVDNGTSAVEEIDNSRIDTVVLDHHNVPERLPKKAILINPRFRSEDKLLEDLSSSALSFYLAGALVRELGLEIDVREFLDLVSLGLLADCMPLNPLNRILSVKGIELMNYILEGKVRKPGVKALLETSGVKRITSKTVYFDLAPRLNAPGRISKPDVALKLLIEKDEKKAKSLAEKLDSLNRIRRIMTRKTFEEVKKKAQRERDRNFIVVWDRGWHPGILGIVAGRLAGELGKPVGVFALGKRRAVGSLRSSEDINIYKEVSKLSDMFLKWGGHDKAMGVTLPSERLDEFKEKVDELFREVSKEEPVVPVDLELNPEELSPALIKQLSQLEPYGEGNPYPVFMGRVRSLKRLSHYEVEINGVRLVVWDEELLKALAVGKRFLYSFTGEELLLEDVENGSP